jgi:histidinol-phosphate phosphatase family protein
MVETTALRTKVMGSVARNRATFLDRDGVLIRSFDGRPANDASEVELLPGVLDGLKLLRNQGLSRIVVTNQGGIALGYTTLKRVSESHDRLDELTEGLISAYYVCPHSPDARCGCRKPRPGMLEEAAADELLDLSKCQIIGDGRSDMEAGVAAGLAKKWLVRTDFSAGGEAFADGVFSDFLSAVVAVVSADRMMV